MYMSHHRLFDLMRLYQWPLLTSYISHVCVGMYTFCDRCAGTANSVRLLPPLLRHLPPPAPTLSSPPSLLWLV
jgi:hypothetical protein